MKLNRRSRSVLALVLALTMVLTAAGCGNSEPENRPYDYNLEEYVTVGQYKGLEYTDFEVEVTDGDVDAALEEILAAFASSTEVTEGTVKSGDYVNITYTMEVDGQMQEGTDEQTYNVIVGDSGLIPEVDEALMGAEVGDTVTVETTLAEDYDINPEFAGKPVKYEIEIQHILLLENPELTDEFAKETLGAKSAEDYREQIRQALYDAKLDDARYAAGEEIWAQVVEASEVLQYPEAELAETEAALIENFKALCEQNGLTFEEALSDILAIDEEEFNAEMHKSAELGVKEYMILYTIARENDLELTEKEIDAYLDSLLTGSGLTESTFEEQYGMTIREYAEANNLIVSMQYQEVFYFLADQGTAK